MGSIPFVPATPSTRTGKLLEEVIEEVANVCTTPASPENELGDIDPSIAGLADEDPTLRCTESMTRFTLRQIRLLTKGSEKLWNCRVSSVVLGLGRHPGVELGGDSCLSS